MTQDPAEREQQRVRFILESIELIGEYTNGGQDAFLRERIVQDAVIRRLETLSDAANLLAEAPK